MVKRTKSKSKNSKDNAKSITGYWKLVNKLVSVYLEQASAAKKKAAHLEIKKLEEEVNDSSIPEFISENFVSPYITNDRDKIKVVFDGEEKKAYGKWIVAYDKETKILKINSVGLFDYSLFIKVDDEKLPKLDRDEDFTQFRMHSFKKEVSKLPEQYLMFLAVLKGVADATAVCISDSRNASSNKMDEHTSCYLSTLWALKQFEEFYQKFQNRSIRADYHLIWHEGEWID